MHEAKSKDFFKPTNTFARYLEPVCKIRKEKYCGKNDYRGKVSSPLFITSSNSTELLYPIDQTLDNVSFTINLFIKRTFMMFILSMRYCVANVLTA